MIPWMIPLIVDTYSSVALGTTKFSTSRGRAVPLEVLQYLTATKLTENVNFETFETLTTKLTLSKRSAAMVQEAPLKIYARGVVSYFYFSRAPRARALKIRQINSAILKVPDGAWIR